jgi:hypothetical protein
MTGFGPHVSIENGNGAIYDTKRSYFGSFHGDITQFCFAAGSLRRLLESVETHVYQALSVMNGQEVIAHGAT